ncbi:acetate kinase [bacterium]|nr:acetate kinase [bacterium]
MLILVINCGSSSLKYTLFKHEQEIASGLVERIGTETAVYTRQVRGKKQSALTMSVPNHERAIRLMMEYLGRDNLVRRPEDIEAVGHRVAHGGPNFTDSALVDERVRNNQIARDLAPLHQVNYDGIEAALKLLPQQPQVAVFDTAFHQTMPAKAYTYALPYRFFTELKIRKYGFHGTSHKYVSLRAAQLLKKTARRINVITLHLGNGSSLAAIQKGKCIDTSMGLTPLAGVVMGTRSGDIDPAIVTYLMEKEGLSAAEVENLLNKKSGILGVSGISNDLREVIKQAGKGNARAKLCLQVLAYSIQKYIGAYHAILGGVDALVFTAGIGEKSPMVRKLICDGLQGLGVKLDVGKNRKTIAQEKAIHAAGSKIKILVIPTREEYMIAQETRRIIHKAKK